MPYERSAAAFRLFNYLRPPTLDATSVERMSRWEELTESTREHYRRAADAATGTLGEEKMEIEVGDTVTVKFVVTEKPGPGNPYVHGPFFCRTRVENVVHVEKRPPQVGDTVIWSGGHGPWRIIALDGGRAWITNEKHNHTPPLGELVSVR